MRYGLTGATGFVGGVLSRQLIEAGHTVRALVRRPEVAADLDRGGVEIVPGDLTDVPALDTLCTGIDGLFHVAGWYKLGSPTPEDGWAANVDGTRLVLAAAARAGVPRIVYTSTLAVNSDTCGRIVDESHRFVGRHLSVYDETKARAHDAAVAMAAAGVPVVIVQPGLVYGPGDTSGTGALIEQIVGGRRPPVPTAGRLCWGFVDDIARGHLLGMEVGRVGESYFLAGPPASLLDALRIAARLAGTRGPLAVPGWAVKVVAALASAVETVTPLPADYAAETLRAATATYLGSPAKAEAELGWSCRPLADGMASTVAALRPT